MLRIKITTGTETSKQILPISRNWQKLLDDSMKSEIILPITRNQQFCEFGIIHIHRKLNK